MPITTPSNVSTERSLFAHSDRSAIRMASAMFMDQVLGVRCWVLGLDDLGVRLRLDKSNRLKFHETSKNSSRHSENRAGRRNLRPKTHHRTPFAYNDLVGSRTGRSLSAFSDAGRGKSELRRAVCRITAGRPGSRPVDGKCHRKHTATAFAGWGKGEKVR